MTSRKRNKGKERKAKQAEMKAESEKARSRDIWSRWARGESNQCNHGCNVIPDVNVDHPVSCFMDEFHMKFSTTNNIADMIKNLRETVPTHPLVWNNDIYRKVAVKILLSMGTNMLLNNPTSTIPPVLATVILLLENYDGSCVINSTVNNRVVATKVRDLFGGSKMRDLLKFFSKRMSCSCLKEMYSEARKAVPKRGKCMHCEEVKERAMLMVCSRCRINQYCSMECQVADWSRHKCNCDAFVRAQQQQGKDVTIIRTDQTSYCMKGLSA